MNFHEWWYDYRIKNQIGENTQKKEVAQAAWLAAQSIAPEVALINSVRRWHHSGQHFYEAGDGTWVRFGDVQKILGPQNSESK